jgi:hypothetical protein
MMVCGWCGARFSQGIVCPMCWAGGRPEGDVDNPASGPPQAQFSAGKWVLIIAAGLLVAWVIFSVIGSVLLNLMGNGG